MNSCLGGDVIPSQFTTFASYYTLTRDEEKAVVALSLVLSPDELLGKVIFAVESGSRVLNGSSCEFYKITEAKHLVAGAATSEGIVMFQGRTVKAVSFMVFTHAWVMTHFINPMKNQAYRLQSVPYQPRVSYQPPRSTSTYPSSQPISSSHSYDRSVRPTSPWTCGAILIVLAYLIATGLAAYSIYRPEWKTWESSDGTETFTLGFWKGTADIEGSPSVDGDVSLTGCDLKVTYGGISSTWTMFTGNDCYYWQTSRGCSVAGAVVGGLTGLYVIRLISQHKATTPLAKWFSFTALLLCAIPLGLLPQAALDGAGEPNGIPLDEDRPYKSMSYSTGVGAAIWYLLALSFLSWCRRRA